ncbi:MAG TPA: hypothetical protein VKR56_14305 [Candidatus Cybelea sp.]|nr:hypothetical protein [Candidatus Cybelea sp.]
MIFRTRIAWAAAALSGAAVLIAALSACGNGGASEPPQTSYDPAATSKLQFAVGVATISFAGGQKVAYGLNEVETLRQRNGLSGTLYNVPMIIGPSKFDVLYSTETGQEVQYAGNDLGTNHVTWGTLNNGNWIGSHRGGKDQSTSGAFGYGLCACNSDSGPPNGVSPLYVSYNLPIYGGGTLNWYGGPPAYPQEGPSVIALGWSGYSLGFTDFAVQPVIGTYHLYAAVPPAYDTPQDPTPSPNPNGTPTPPPGILAVGAQLTSLKALPAFATPSFKPDGKGGGIIGITVPAGAREAMVVAEAVNGGNGICGNAHIYDAYYTVVTHRTGAQKLVLADNLGLLTQSGQKTPTFCHRESYDMYAAAMDYPAYEASYPENLSQLPLIKGPNGQADVSTSDKLFGLYP